MSDRKRCLDDQDPDYPDVTTEDKKRQKLTIERARVDTCERMKNVIRNQFEMEIQQREGQLLECQERLHQARQALHLLRYIVVTSYYHGNTVSKEQSRLHPAVKKLVGTRKNLETVLTLDIPVTNFYPGIVPATSTGGGNSPVAASSSNATSLESSQYSAPTKQPRYIAPKEKNSKEGVSPPRAANLKTKTRLVVGNISKWIHDDMREDAATHKWMLYVRGPPEAPDISHMVERVRFFLHSSYQPNDVIEVANPPFYLSRRGWGEFPVRVQVHFHNPQNRPLDVIHQLRLDHTYTGLQTLGAETVVDVWLFGSNSKAESTNSNTEPSNQPNISNSSTDILMKEHPTEEFSLLSQQTNNTSPRLNTNRSLLKSINTRGSRQQERIETRIVEVDGIKDTNVTISHAQEKKDFHNSSVSQTKSVCGSKNETYNLNSAQHTFFKQNTTSHSTSMNIHEHDSKDNSSIVFQKKACNISCAIDQKQNSNHLISNKNSNQLDVALKLQHHDYAKPRQETVGLMCKDATTSSTKSILFCSKITSIKPNSSGSFCDRTNLTEIAGRKIINLKSRSTLNVSKCINVKNPIKIFNTSLLKSSVLKPDQNNTEKNISLINGSKVTITGSSTKIPKHVICLSINRNGALQHVPNFIRQTVPPLVMLSRPTEKKKQPMCLKQPTQCQFKHIDFNSIKIENERNNELLQYYKQHMKDLEIRKVDDEQVAILHLLRSLPLIKEADSAYFQLHPYVVASAEKFLAWPLGKRRAAEARQAALEQERLAKEEKEKEERQAQEAQRKQREVAKNALRKEKKALRNLCKENNYFAASSEESVNNMIKMESMCDVFSVEKLAEVTRSLQGLSLEEGIKKYSFWAAELDSRLEKERAQVMESAVKGSGTRSKGGSGSEWSPDDLQLLIKAVNLFPAGTNQRWEVVAQFVNQHTTSKDIQRTAKEVLAKTKGLQSSDYSSLKDAANKKAFEDFEKGQRSGAAVVADSEASQRFDTPAEQQGFSAPWTAQDQQLLEQALRTYPANTPERWDRIAECIPNRSKKECMRRFKELAEIVKAKKAAQAKVKGGGK